MVIGDPDAIRTHDLQIRNLLLYPAELRDRVMLLQQLRIARKAGFRPDQCRER